MLSYEDPYSHSIKPQKQSVQIVKSSY